MHLPIQISKRLSDWGFLNIMGITGNLEHHVLLQVPSSAQSHGFRTPDSAFLTIQSFSGFANP